MPLFLFGLGGWEDRNFGHLTDVLIVESNPSFGVPMKIPF
ncbi:hypothetical protein LEP1GSC196_0427 [Leptospira meyeri serovar Semaranga str. Veldrot Semarang 173]|nr:hypothetical protein LEP1GSC196_0427 [Leptospira meyeri serovar Semaranga str. Veldrot Semarang 173]